jgi:hypothetical protein
VAACIGLGNEVSLLLLRRPHGELDVARHEQFAYERLSVIWAKLRELRERLEQELPALEGREPRVPNLEASVR